MPNDYGLEIVEEVQEELLHPLLEALDGGNLVGELDDQSQVASDIIDGYEEAYNSMDDWREKYEEALKLAKLEPKAKKKTFPFEGASTAMLPFILDAMLDFNARSAPELAFSKKIVAAKIYGQNVTGKEERAERVAEYSNYQLSELMPDWREEQDKNLLALPCAGTTYKETYYDSDTQEVCSDLYLGDEIVFNQEYKSFKAAPDKYRKFSQTRNECITAIRGSEQWDMDEADLSEDDDEEFIKAYTWVDLDDDGLDEPYCIVVWEKQSKCVYMRPLYDEDTLTLDDSGEVIKAEMVDILTQYRFMPDPEGGPMGMGWGILLGRMFKDINTSLRQQIDAGTLSTTAANSGLINMDMTSRRGNAVQAGPIEVKMGQLTPVQNRGSGNLAQNVVQFPFNGPNPSMFQLLQYMTATANEMTTTSANLEPNSNEAAVMFMARLQQNMKRPNVIVMRIYQAAKKEFQNIFALNGKHYSDEKYNKVLDGEQDASMKADFNADDCDIALVADPSQGSDMERSARANAILQEAKEQPVQILNLREAYINWLEVIGTAEDEIEILTPEPQGPSQQEQMMAAQQAAEMEFRNRDQQLREQDQELKAAKLRVEQTKAAITAAKEMAAAGLSADKTESEITKNYVESMERLVNMGSADPIGDMKAVEEVFIDYDYNPATGGLTPRA